MKRSFGALVIALYLLILSSLFVPLSHVSWVQFAKALLIRLAIVAAFAAATSIFLNLGAVEPYRITETPRRTIATDEVPSIELQNAPPVDQLQSPRKRRRSPVAFWVSAAAIYCVTRTSWWEHQAWVNRFTDTFIRWAIFLACWGFIVLLWLPKPDANQPEKLHVVPLSNSKTNASHVPKSTP